MQSFELTLLILVVSISLVSGMVLYFVNKSTHYKKRDLEVDIREAELEKKKFELSIVEQRINSEQYYMSDSMGSGYIIVSMSEDEKGVFSDMLKGFEEFAAVRGYRVSFSYDSSYPNKFLFKFTLIPNFVSVSVQQADSDLREYILRVLSGDDFDDLPVVLSESRHYELLFALRGRMKLLQERAAHFKHSLEVVSGLIKDNILLSSAIAPVSNIHIQNLGGGMDSRKYITTHSKNVSQGDGNVMRVDESYVYTVKEVLDRVETIEKLQRALGHVGDDPDLNKVNIDLEKIKDELLNEKNPDKDRISKWLCRAKTAIETLKLGDEVVDLARKVFESFSM